MEANEEEVREGAMSKNEEIWTKVYELAGTTDPTHKILQAPEAADVEKPLMVVVHPGDLTRIDLKEEYEYDWIERDAQYLYQNGMGSEIKEWLERGWDVLVLHGPSSKGFVNRDREAEAAGRQDHGLHDNVECMAEFDTAIGSVHEKGGVMYGEELDAAARDLLESGTYKAASRPAVVLTGSYSDVGCALSRLGVILEEHGVTVYTSCQVPPTLHDDADEDEEDEDLDSNPGRIEEWEPKAGKFHFQAERDLIAALEQASPTL
jgi:hypothetical protein